MQNYCHQIIPESRSFIQPTTAGEYIESWLPVRDAWLMRVAKEPSLALSNQSWCTFLSMGNTVPEKGETKAARRCQEVLDILLPSPELYPGVGKQSGLMGPIFWQG